MIFLDLFQTVGRITIFIFEILANIFKVYKYSKECLVQLLNVGYFSIPIVALTSLFTGAVLAIQSFNAFGIFTSESIIANIVVVSITREIGPVLVGLVMTGRISGSIAAELGSMKVTDQIDAIKTLSVNPFTYLIVPKIIAGLISFPLMLIISDAIGVYSGYLVGVYKFNLNEFLYIKYTLQFLTWGDFYMGLLKSLIFGIIATIVSCYYGYNCFGGAKGVGEAATKSVVISFILILLANYIITNLVFND